MKYKAYAQRIFCFDWSENVSFYQEIVGLPLKFENEDMGWAEFDVGSISLALERLAKEDPEAQSLVGRFVGISLEVSDIDAVYKDLSGKGVTFTSAPEKQPWGGILAHFNDPSGNTITLLGDANA
ncbi:MAG: VOC family protein [Cycloclasticus sp.]|nr:VOC family protein [Cycloclasticus sp.]